MRAYIITVQNGMSKEVDQTLFDNVNAFPGEVEKLVRYEVKTLREMDCGTIKVIECYSDQVDEIEEYIREHGKFGRKALAKFEGAKFW